MPMIRHNDWRDVGQPLSCNAFAFARFLVCFCLNSTLECRRTCFTVLIEAAYIFVTRDDKSLISQDHVCQKEMSSEREQLKVIQRNYGRSAEAGSAAVIDGRRLCRPLAIE